MDNATGTFQKAVDQACAVLGMGRVEVVPDPSVFVARVGRGLVGNVILFNPKLPAAFAFPFLVVIALHELGHIVFGPGNELLQDQVSAAGAAALRLDFPPLYATIWGFGPGNPHPAGPERAAAFLRGWQNSSAILEAVRRRNSANAFGKLAVAGLVLLFLLSGGSH